MFGITQVFADSDNPNHQHEDIPITEQKREADSGNVAIVFGGVAVLIIGGLAWEFLIKKNREADK